MAREAMAATSHPSATLAAVQIMAAGGNAIDAALAANAVQCVVEPGSTGIGGDCFALIAREGSDEIIAFNGSGAAPAAASTEYFAARGITGIARQSPHAVTVPGAVDAWTQLHSDYGRLPLTELLAPAIRFAEEGYVITPRVNHDWTEELELLSGDPTAKRVFLPDGRVPQIGEVHRQPELGATLRRVAAEGRDAFYRGSVAEDMVAYLQSLGGLHTLDDFASAKGEYVEPIQAGYQDHQVHECPPNGQGVIALMILNILSRFQIRGDPISADRLHLEIEATRLAYAARDGLLADPRKAEVPVGYLLCDALADRLAGMIDFGQAIADLPSFGMPQHRDTVYISVVDKDRNAVSFINSLFDFFGSGLVAPRSGVVLHNRGQCFVLDPKHPNAIAPRKRPLHTIIPGMLTRAGRAVMPFGVMEGYYQPMGQAHFLSNVLDFGLDLQEAIDLPRLIVTNTKEVQVEKMTDPTTRAELERRGFRIVPSNRPIGGAQAIMIDWKHGTLHGGSDSRKDGCALGL